jgi:hypothetical protein
VTLVLFHVLLSRKSSITIHDNGDRTGYFSSFEDSDEEPLVPSHRHYLSFLLCA